MSDTRSTVMLARTDTGRWRARVRLEKYHEDADVVRAGRATPYEIIEREGNMLVNAGIQLMLDRLIGASGTEFSNANSRIGVGDSNTAATASQTDLQAATNKVRVGMESGYPQRTDQTMSWRSVFDPSTANFQWREWAIFNSGSGGTMLNRKVEDLGTKSGGTWTLTVSVTIS